MLCSHRGKATAYEANATERTRGRTSSSCPAMLCNMQQCNSWPGMLVSHISCLPPLLDVCAPPPPPLLQAALPSCAHSCKKGAQRQLQRRVLACTESSPASRFSCT